MGSSQEPNVIKIHGDSKGRFIGVGFNCPGCGDRHVLPISPPPEGHTESPSCKGFHHWTWNGSFIVPTFHPSVHVRVGHFADPHWCECINRSGFSAVNGDLCCYNCHSWVRDGMIQFLPDCSHSLAGQTVKLPPIEQQFNDLNWSNG